MELDIADHEKKFQEIADKVKKLEKELKEGRPSESSSGDYQESLIKSLRSGSLNKSLNISNAVKDDGKDSSNLREFSNMSLNKIRESDERSIMNKSVSNYFDEYLNKELSHKIEPIRYVELEKKVTLGHKTFKEELSKKVQNITGNIENKFLNILNDDKEHHNEWIQYKNKIFSNFSWIESNSQSSSYQNEEINKIIEIFYSKIRELNLKEWKTDIKDSFNIEKSDLSLTYQTIIRCVLDIIYLLKQKEYDLSKRNLKAYQEMFINNAIEYLNKSFNDFIVIHANNVKYKDKTKLKFPNDITKYIYLYYISSTYSRIKNPDKIHGIPVWFLILNLIRIGQYNNASNVIKSLSPEHHILNIVLNSLNNNEILTLTEDQLDELSILSKTKSISKLDPYEDLVIKVLTFSKIETESLKILETVEEYVWFKLVRIKLTLLIKPDFYTSPLTFIEEELLNDFYLQSFSSSLLFSKCICYFLVGSFEKAIYSLSEDDIGLIFAVHFCILLWKNSLLNYISDPNQPILIPSKNEHAEYTINISALLSRYFYRFYNFLKLSFLDYLACFIPMENEIIYCLSDNIFKYTSEMQKSILNDSNIMISTLYKRSVISVCKYFTSINEHLIALPLLLVVNELKECALVMIEVLLKVIVYPDFYSSSTLIEFENYGKIIGNKILADTSLQNEDSDNLFLLLDLNLFFKQFRLNNYAHALEIIYTLNILPNDFAKIDKCIENYKKIPEKLTFLYKDIICSAACSLKKVYHELKYEVGKIDPNELSQIKDQATALLSFSAQLSIVLPKHISMSILSDVSEIRR